MRRLRVEQKLEDVARARELGCFVQPCGARGFRKLCLCLSGLFLLAISSAHNASLRIGPASKQRLMPNLQQKFFCDSIYDVVTIPQTTWTTLVNGAKLLVYSGNDYVSKHVAATSIWEQPEYYSIARALKLAIPTTDPAYTADIFVDVGANMGFFAISAAKMGARVFAFEAMRKNALMIRSSLCANPDIAHLVTFFNIGLGDVENTCKIWSLRSNAGDGNLDCSKPYSLPPEAEWRGEVFIKRLDAVLNTDVKVMKIDVEGYEPKIIAGASQLLSQKKVNFIMLEINKERLNALKYTDDDLHQWLQSFVNMGYHLSASNFSGPYYESTKLRNLPNHHPWAFNIYLVHSRVLSYARLL